MNISFLGLQHTQGNFASLFGLPSMTKCKGPHHDFDDITTYDFTTFTTSRLVIDLESNSFLHYKSGF